jgi:H+/gluconate symporter-like permease
VAPFCAAIVALLSGLDVAVDALEGKTIYQYVLDTYTGDYMRGTAGYFTTWFPAFFLGAVYGKVMDMTGSARSLADWLVNLIGAKRAVLAVAIPCLLMTYGGISLFVVVFVIYPMGYAIYRAANLPRTLLPSVIAFGAFGITMTSVPGTPQIQNLIPIQFYGPEAVAASTARLAEKGINIPVEYAGSDPRAAVALSIAGMAVMGILGWMYLEWRANKCRAEGKGFVEDPKYVEVVQDRSHLPSWHWMSGLLPLIVVVILLNAPIPGLKEIPAQQRIVPSLLGGIFICCLMNISQAKSLLPAISAGANGSLVAIMNTSCAVGFGSVVRVVPGFAALTALMMTMPGNILVSQAVAVNALAGATGSASGGMSIALSALGPMYLDRALEMGLNPELLHRIASIASGGLDTLPHNGAILTLLAVSNCTHKESYFDIAILNVFVPTASSLVLALSWGSFI